MMRNALDFGAPVTDAGGNVAANRSAQRTLAGTSAVTVETRWTRPGWASSRSRLATSTEPVTATRPRSLRTRSTIITFSARSLSVRSPAVTPVPLIGPDAIRSPSRWRNSSGDADATITPASGAWTTAAYGAGLPRARAAPRACRLAGLGAGADRTRQMLAW